MSRSTILTRRLQISLERSRSLEISCARANIYWQLQLAREISFSLIRLVYTCGAAVAAVSVLIVVLLLNKNNKNGLVYHRIGIG